MKETQKTTVGIHWLTATIDPFGTIDDTPLAAEYVAARLLRQQVEGETVPYPRNYTRAIETAYGRLSWHPKQPRMKICYAMNGNDCERAYADGVSVSKILSVLYNHCANFTRIDIAIDYYGSADIGAIADVFGESAAWTTAHTIQPFRQLTRSERGVSVVDSGVYIGSRHSDRFICVYNKALERGEDMTDWTRIELRVRKERANALAEMVVDAGLGPAARAAIRDFANVPLDWWQEALAGDATEMIRGHRRQSDTARWLIGQVAPILARELLRIDSPLDPLYVTFASVIRSAGDRLMSRR